MRAVVTIPASRGERASSYSVHTVPSSTTTLGHDRSAFVIAEATEQIQAIGKVFPRVQFELRLRTPNERVQAEIHELRLRVKFANEVLGEGTSGGEYVDTNDRRMRIEVPIGRSALAFVNENMQADRLDLTLSLQGWMRIRREPWGDAGEPPAEWTFTSFGVMGMADISRSRGAIGSSGFSSLWGATSTSSPRCRSSGGAAALRSSGRWPMSAKPSGISRRETTRQCSNTAGR